MFAGQSRAYRPYGDGPTHPCVGALLPDADVELLLSSSAGQGPSPAQLALAKMQARQTLRNFLVAIGLIRVVPFAFEQIYALFR